jgi:toxin HigB-1
MIKTFSQPWLEEFWHTGKHKRAPSELEARLLRKMDMVNRAAALKDLKAPPSNHLHALHGDREGQWALGGYVFVSRTATYLNWNWCNIIERRKPCSLEIGVPHYREKSCGMNS